MIFIIPQNGNLCWLPGNCSQSSYSLPVKKGALPIEIKIIMSISCASTQMLLLNGCLQGWLLDGQMCEWYPPPSSTEMVWDFCRSPLCQTEPQQISPIHHHQHFTGLWTQYCILNSRREKTEFNTDIIPFVLYVLLTHFCNVCVRIGHSQETPYARKADLRNANSLKTKTPWATYCIIT